MRHLSIRSIWLFLCLLTLLLPGSVYAEPTADLNRFLITYTKPVFDMLTRTHAYKMTEYGRYVILSSKKSYPQYDIECLFYDKDSRIHCEATSGYYDKSRAKLSAKARNAIRNMGFRGDDSKGNFQREFTVTGPQTLWEVAGVMLETLYRGYGVRRGDMKACGPHSGVGRCDYPNMWTHLAGGVAEKLDEAFANKIIAITIGHEAHSSIRDSATPFFIYIDQPPRKWEDTAPWYALNPWTGDVWNIYPGRDCKAIATPALAEEQAQIKKRFSKDELKEYERLRKIMPHRMSDLKPCGSLKEK